MFKVTFFLSVPPEDFLSVAAGKEDNGNFMIGEGDVFVVPFRIRGRTGMYGYRAFCASETGMISWFEKIFPKTTVQVSAVEYDVLTQKDWISDLRDRPLLLPIDEEKGLYRSMSGVGIVVIDPYLNLQLRSEKGKGTLQFLNESIRSIDVLLSIEEFEKESVYRDDFRESC